VPHRAIHCPYQAPTLPSQVTHQPKAFPSPAFALFIPHAWLLSNPSQSSAHHTLTLLLVPRSGSTLVILVLPPPPGSLCSVGKPMGTGKLSYATFLLFTWNQSFGLLCLLLASLAYSLTLKIEVACSCGTSVDFQWAAWCYIQEESNQYSHCFQYLKSYILKKWVAIKFLFQTILNRKWIKQMFAYMEVSAGFIYTHFNWPDEFLGYSPSNWIVGFLQVFKQLIYYPFVLPLLLQYLLNAEYRSSSSSVTSESTLKICSNCLCMVLTLREEFCTTFCI
jgi:hypothetical protein